MGVLMPTGAYIWLAARDRLDALAENAHAEGPYGPLISTAVGLGFGLLSAYLVTVTSARSAAYRSVEQRARRALGDLPDRALVWIALILAVGEEFLFRLAVQDALGIGWSIALYALTNWMPGLTLWTATVAVLAVAWSWMVHAGLGLLASATAHAVFSYLTLRRWNAR